MKYAIVFIFCAALPLLADNYVWPEGGSANRDFRLNALDKKILQEHKSSGAKIFIVDAKNNTILNSKNDKSAAPKALAKKQKNNQSKVIYEMNEQTIELR